MMHRFWFSSFSSKFYAVEMIKLLKKQFVHFRFQHFCHWSIV